MAHSGARMRGGPDTARSGPVRHSQRQRPTSFKKAGRLCVQEAHTPTRACSLASRPVVAWSEPLACRHVAWYPPGPRQHAVGRVTHSIGQDARESEIIRVILSFLSEYVAPSSGVRAEDAVKERAG